MDIYIYIYIYIYMHTNLLCGVDYFALVDVSSLLSVLLILLKELYDFYMTLCMMGS